MGATQACCVPKRAPKHVVQHISEFASDCGPEYHAADSMMKKEEITYMLETRALDMPGPTPRTDAQEEQSPEEQQFERRKEAALRQSPHAIVTGTGARSAATSGVH
mmetsp:Transcript_58578/g.136852  ORF Transcript_58578/g.136852 Transcript_58578/m.136852 type:complete len:106 (-) Transcript_58578:135-452(-)